MKYYLKDYNIRYIYILKDNGTPFYVGQTKNVKGRLSNHKANALKNKSVKDKRIMDIILNNRIFDYEIICQCDVSKANKAERQTIKAMQQSGYELLNVTQPKDIWNEFKVKNMSLSDIEFSVLKLIADDLNSIDIAEKCFRSVRTVETIRRKLCYKFDTNTSHGLIYKAYKLGLVR